MKRIAVEEKTQLKITARRSQTIPREDEAFVIKIKSLVLKKEIASKHNKSKLCCCFEQWPVSSTNANAPNCNLINRGWVLFQLKPAVPAAHLLQ
jgi:hypothetical protein